MSLFSLKTSESEEKILDAHRVQAFDRLSTARKACDLAADLPDETQAIAAQEVLWAQAEAQEWGVAD